ncbi:MAG TPA: hypothetical protein VG755_03025 [Nannocystaceae bacterium]|nr:hypothetical protein [Nannocystaceae bacterium]
MTIHFFVNDPDARGAKVRKIKPHANRPANRAGFDFVDAVPQKPYDPKTEPDEFVFWQCREAALRAVAAWERATGKAILSWHEHQRIEVLPQVEDDDTNAYYERGAVSFSALEIAGKFFRMAVSTDVVAHEIGHAVLDAMRPELWDSHGTETAAFHESFGDCLAILTALQDPQTRRAVVKTRTRKNVVETWGENMAKGSKALDPEHNASAPRRARNAFEWQLPTTLADDGGPGELINECHSFGQIFTGCFYDAILGVFDLLEGVAERRLLRAANIVGALLGEAIENAPVVTRFFRAIGRAMVKADEAQHASKYRAAIVAAFERHNVVLGVGAMLTPARALPAPPPPTGPKRSARPRGIPEALRAPMPAGAVPRASRSIRLGNDVVTAVVQEREVPLDHLDTRLTGVVGRSLETMLVGKSGDQAAVLEAVPDAQTTIEDVDGFVRSLLRHGEIDFASAPASDKKAPLESAKRSPAANRDKTRVRPNRAATHTIRVVDGQPMLTRVRFLCGCR